MMIFEGGLHSWGATQTSRGRLGIRDIRTLKDNGFVGGVINDGMYDV